MTIRAFITNHPVLTYYALAFVISWGAILILVGPAGFLATTSTSPTFALVGFASLLGPSVAGILITALVDGRAGLRELRSRMLRWRVGVRWYGVALLTAPLVTTLTLLALSLTSPAFLPAIVTAEDKASLLLSGIAVGLIVPVFEELGWTGFATPRLRLRHGVLGTGLIMGVLWGAWHFPLFVGSAASSGGIPPALFMAAMLFSWLPPYRVLMVWVHDRTQSLLVVMLMHTPIVVSQFVLNPEAMSGEAMFTSLIATGAALWLVVGAVALANGGHITQDQGGRAPRKLHLRMDARAGVEPQAPPRDPATSHRSRRRSPVPTWRFMMSLLLALFLAIHASIHIGYICGPAWPFVATDPWLVTALGASTDTVRTVGIALVLVTFLAYVVAAVTAMGLLRSLWKPLIVVASVASAIVLVVFVTPWTLPGLAIDAVVIWATQVHGWRPTPIFGRTRHASSSMQEAAR